MGRASPISVQQAPVASGQRAGDAVYPAKLECRTRRKIATWFPSGGVGLNLDRRAAGQAETPGLPVRRSHLAQLRVSSASVCLRCEGALHRTWKASLGVTGEHLPGRQKSGTAYATSDRTALRHLDVQVLSCQFGRLDSRSTRPSIALPDGLWRAYHEEHPSWDARSYQVLFVRNAPSAPVPS